MIGAENPRVVSMDDSAMGCRWGETSGQRRGKQWSESAHEPPNSLLFGVFRVVA